MFYIRGCTIGIVKKHLERIAVKLNNLLSRLCGQSLISINKCLITQASCVIPVFPLYVALLYKVMKEFNCHEGIIEQMWRLYTKIYIDDHIVLDDMGRIRVDDLELMDDIQRKVKLLWKKVKLNNLKKNFRYSRLQ